ncbi:MAG: hypothetical protein IBX55_23940, partial [Methyloprofundus sp.]|nr:hypothetical protein [Methyloprofundus sp.]
AQVNAYEMLLQSVWQYTQFDTWVDMRNQQLWISQAWPTKANSEWQFDMSWGRLRIDGHLKVVNNYIHEGLLDIEQIDYLALRLGWIKNWGAWQLAYRASQVLPYDIKTRPYDRLGTTGDAETSSSSVDGGKLLSDWPSGHQQRISVTYSF